MSWLFIIFVLVPALELYLLIEIGQMIGATNTFLIILTTGLLGSYLAKSQGMMAWRRLNEKMSSGSLPGKELVDGAIILISGTLLITPGVLTDFVGFLGLFPFTRIAIRSFAVKLFKTASPLVGRMGVYTSMRTSAEPERAEGSEARSSWSGAAKQKPSYDATYEDV